MSILFVTVSAVRSAGSTSYAQPLLFGFFPPVVCEPVMLSSALRRMAFERAWSVTTRETVIAPIRVNAATIPAFSPRPAYLRDRRDRTGRSHEGRPALARGLSLRHPKRDGPPNRGRPLGVPARHHPDWMVRTAGSGRPSAALTSCSVPEISPLFRQLHQTTDKCRPDRHRKVMCFSARGFEHQMPFVLRNRGLTCERGQNALKSTAEFECFRLGPGPDAPTNLPN
jgi:hypothetical protein